MMGQVLKFFAIGLILTSTSACADVNPRAYIAEGKLYIDSSLDNQLYSEISAMNLDNIDAVAITSMGGSVSASFKIAELLSKTKKKIIVKGICASACASIILSSFDIRILEPGAVVIMHGTQTGLLRIYELANRSHPGLFVQSPVVKELAEKEKLLYIQHGISTDSLLFPHMSQGELSAI